MGILIEIKREEIIYFIMSGDLIKENYNKKGM